MTATIKNEPALRRKSNRTFKSRWNLVRFRFQESFHALRGRRIVHLLHIGKTGGTAVKHALASHLVTSTYLIRRHGHKTLLGHIPKGQSVVFFLREPHTRFVSAFYSRLREGRPRYNNPWRPHEKVIFQRFPTPNRLALALSSSDEEVRSHAEHAMRSISHLRDSYFRWFGSEDYFLSRLADVFFIGFQETLTEDFDKLRIKLGLPKTLALPDDDVLAHRTPADVDRNLEEQAVVNLRRWYAADYNFVELCRAQAKQINAR